MKRTILWSMLWLSCGIVLIMHNTLLADEGEWNRKIPEKELKLYLKSNDFNLRTTAMEYIADSLQNKEMTLQGEIKALCYQIIDDHINGRITIDTKKDDEGQYTSAINDLAAQINDKRFLPYFLKCIPSSTCVRAIINQGDDAIEKLIDIGDDKKMSDMKKIDWIHSLRDVANYKKNGLGKDDKIINKIKAKVLGVLDDSPIAGEMANSIDYNARAKFKRRAALRKNAMWLLADFNDEKLIPVFVKIAKEDPYYREVKRGQVDYLKMTDEELMKHTKQNANDVIAASINKNEKMVKYFELREEAQKILKKLQTPK